MRIVIIEDEKPAYNRLSKMIKELIPDCKEVAHMDSVEASKKWFENNEMPDVVLLDIQLADGTGFDLLKQSHINCPIIFTTAYDQYALEAFKTTGIEYLLKPVKKDELDAAFKKIDKIKNFLTEDEKLVPLIPQVREYKKRFIIRFGEHIKTLQAEDVAYFYSENKATFARTFENKNYPMDYNLDALEGVLNPQDFFRINRQYLINLQSIEDMKTYSKARVIVNLKPPVKELPVVSSERSADFKQWLGGD